MSIHDKDSVLGSWRCMNETMTGGTKELMNSLGYEIKDDSEVEAFAKLGNTLTISEKDGGVVVSMVFDDPNLSDKMRPKFGPIQMYEPYEYFIPIESKKQTFMMTEFSKNKVFSHILIEPKDGRKLYIHESVEIVEKDVLAQVVRSPKANLASRVLFKRIK
ncbi:uncharacterized protein LOC106011009 [Aplysia californica]|uniref:Uncharacterized protein LOC106011009 n=1 Tax=Aplysia californica TaxID=6500 RepID=A0ABM1AG20_APLCA|nr:uncharacterized protein LOC106011009 [Aplysia californica]